MATVYKSKLDAWLAIVLVVAMTVSLGAGISSLASTDRLTAWITLIILASVGVGLPFWLVSSTRYVIDGDHLRVYSGPFRWRVPLATITNIAPSRNPLSSPALSLDRLRIDYGRGQQLLISPRDKEGFLTAIDEARRRVLAGSSNPDIDRRPD